MAKRRPGGPAPLLALVVAALLVALTMAGYFAATDSRAQVLAREADAPARMRDGVREAAPPNLSAPSLPGIPPPSGRAGRGGPR